MAGADIFLFFFPQLPLACLYIFCLCTFIDKRQCFDSVLTGATLGPGTEITPEQQQRTGLKAWWNRMSNRFRNLKLGRTFNTNTNRLAPMPADLPPTPTSSSVSIRSASPKVRMCLEWLRILKALKRGREIVGRHI